VDGPPICRTTGIICTGEPTKCREAYLLQGASLKDPAVSSTRVSDGNARRAIDIHEGE